jgi:Lon-like protease
VSFLDDESLGTRDTPSEPPDMSVAPELLPETSGDEATAGLTDSARKRKRWKVISSIGIVLAVVVIVTSLVTLPYYALTPGTAQNVGPLIGVPKSLTQQHLGAIDLVDVEVTRLRMIDWLWFKLNSNAVIISSAEVQGPETNAQYNTEGVLDMSDAQQAATVVALNVLGYHVAVRPNGALLYALDPGSPADQQLLVGDVVVSVGKATVSSLNDLGANLSTYKPGQSVVLGYRAYPSGTLAHVTLNMGVWRLQGKGASAQLDCVPSNVKSPYPIAQLIDDKGSLYFPAKGHPGHPVACLGVLDPEQSYSVGKLPFTVNLNSEGIVGPSAGLAFTLGLIQKLDAANLTNGHEVAATGTMSVTGQIGPIGGIQQKTIAVRAAGASIFLVPPANYKTAEQYAGPTLKVFSVSSIGQAIKVLERFGGKVERPASS